MTVGEKKMSLEVSVREIRGTKVMGCIKIEGTVKVRIGIKFMKNHDFDSTSNNGDLSVDDRNAVLAQVEGNSGGRNISLVASNHLITQQR